MKSSSIGNHTVWLAERGVENKGADPSLCSGLVLDDTEETVSKTVVDCLNQGYFICSKGFFHKIKAVKF